MVKSYSIVCIDHILFLHLLVDKHLGCFYLLAILNTVAVNICVQVFVWIHVFGSLGYICGSGIVGSSGNFNILKSC